MLTEAAPGRRPARALWAWAFYDFANSPFTTIIVTFLYPAYFSSAIVGESVRGTVLWSRAVTASAVAVALLSPLLGALADCSGRRKEHLFGATATCIALTAVLALPRHGDVLAALALFFAANTAYELAMVFYNALLPGLASPNRVGRVSGLGWALGYLGGLLALAVALAFLLSPGEWWPSAFAAEGDRVRFVPWLVAGWYGAFTWPIFLWVPDSSTPREGGWREALGRLARAGKDLARLRPLAWLLAARLLYNDALVTVFAFGGIYASGTFGFTTKELLLFGITLNVTAGLGAWSFGYVDDRLGGKRTVLLALLGLGSGTLGAVLAPNATAFWICSLWLGLFVGPVQSASRSLMSRFVPRGMENELFGFYQLSGKLTAFAGPLLLGILTDTFQSQRAGVAGVLALLGAGGLLLAFVDEAEGIRLARQASSGR